MEVHREIMNQPVFLDWKLWNFSAISVTLGSIQ